MDTIVRARRNIDAQDGVLMTLAELRKNPNFKCISFVKIDFDERVTGEVVAFFAGDTRTWKELILFYCTGDVDAITMICLKMNNVEGLRLLFPEGPSCRQVSPILGLGSMLKINSSLAALTVQVRTMDSMEAKSLASGLRMNRTMRSLNLMFRSSPQGENVDTAFLELAKGFKHNKSLEVVDVNFMNCDYSCIFEALKDSRSVRKLIVRFPYLHASLVDLLRTSQATINSFKFESLSRRLPEDIIQSVQSHGSIVFLDLQACPIPDPVATVLARLLLRNNSAPALRFLNLECCEITDFGTNVIASALETNSTLHNLNLNENDFGLAGAAALAHVLRTNSCLQELALSQNFLTDACIEPFADALCENSTLRILNLALNDITDHGAGRIAGALQHNSTLQDLDLSSNGIRNNGAAALSRALLNASGLCKLKMSGNPIGFEGAESIARAMRTNSTLKVVALSSPNNRGNEDMKRLELEILKDNFQLECFEPCRRNYSYSREGIMHTLDLNRGGRKVLQNPNLPLGLWPFVLKRADTILYYNGEMSANSEGPQQSVLYSLLRNRPALFSRPFCGSSGPSPVPEQQKKRQRSSLPIELTS
jgi:Ran GTPase-activating protein (RanGAP) involved in mRNA processing and transport